LVYKIIQTTAGRVIFNGSVPEAAGYINDVLTKKNLRDIIGHVLKRLVYLKRLVSWTT
jgi:DNA-directed RNA polymerase subunit beta'